MKCSIVYPGRFIAWVTCMLSSYEDHIVAGMVKKGYVVSAAAANGQVSVGGGKDNPAVTVCIRIDSSNEEITASEINNHLIEVLKEKKFLYYSVIVSAFTHCCWNSSNIVLPQPTPKVPPPIPPAPNGNLN